MNEDSERATADQLRAAIDSGRTGEKVAALDPAAAPLGTDEEAAGTPTSPEQFHDAIRQETAKAPESSLWAGRGIWLGMAIALLALTAIGVVVFIFGR